MLEILPMLAADTAAGPSFGPMLPLAFAGLGAGIGVGRFSWNGAFRGHCNLWVDHCIHEVTAEW